MKIFLRTIMVLLFALSIATNCTNPQFSHTEKNNATAKVMQKGYGSLSLTFDAR